MTKICFGCGTPFQTKEKDKKGYVPEEKLETARYCMRCFRMMHYGERGEVETPKEAKEIIRKVNKDNKFVIFLIDYLNLNQYVIDLFQSIKGDKLLVVNKGELLPSNITYLMLKNYIRDIYKVNSDIKVKGGKSNHGISSIYKYLMDHDIHEAYLLGISNSGKSTFINDMSNMLESRINKINTNKHANTTLDFMRVKLCDELTLIDSPGFIIPTSLNNDVSDKSIKMITYNIKGDECISLLQDRYFIRIFDPTSVTFLTNVDEKKLMKKDYKKNTIMLNDLEVKDNQDVIVYGVGILRFKNGTKMMTTLPLDSIEVRDSIFGGKYE